MKKFLFALALVPSLVVAQPAQFAPTKPVTIIVPAAPGGSADSHARIIGEYLRSIWGQSVLVESKPGANTILGTDFVSKAKPDGYTLLLNSGAYTINPAVYKTLPYDPITSLVPVTSLTKVTFGLVVNPSLPFDNVADLIKSAQANPEKLNMGASESSALMMAHRFNMLAGTKMQVVTYKGAGPMLNDLMGNHVQMSFSALSSSQAHIKSGKLKLLGITSKTPSSLFPDAPLLAKGRLESFEQDVWFGIFAPKGTPAPLVEALNKDFQRALADPEVSSRLKALGVDISGAGPQQFLETVKKEVSGWKEIAKQAGVEPE